MGVGPIQFGGLVSGLDTNAIITTLLDLGARPIRALESQQSEARSRLSLIGTFEGLVKTLQGKVDELASSTGSFFAYKVTPSDESVATFTTTGTPPVGSHTLEVTGLASADRYSFATTYTDPDAQTIGPGSLEFQYDGTTYTTTVSSASSINELAGAINSTTDGAVTASVINVGTQASPSYQLVLAGKDTGADFQITGFVDSGLGLGATANLTAASNAQVVIDGLTVERSTNVFDDVVQGLSFTAQSTTTQAISVGVELDVEGTEGRLQGFVDAYNGVIDFINKQNSYSEEGGPGGVLFGDNLLRSVRSRVQAALFNVSLETIQADTEGYASLGLVGFDLDSDGRLSIDSAEFEAKLSANPQALEGLFTDAADGVLTKLDGALDGLLKSSAATSTAISVPSPFENRRNSINSLIDSLDDQIQRLQDNLDREEESLIQRFANLESILSGLNGQSAFLSQNLGLSGSR